MRVIVRITTEIKVGPFSKFEYREKIAKAEDLYVLPSGDICLTHFYMEGGMIRSSSIQSCRFEVLRYLK